MVRSTVPPVRRAWFGIWPLALVLSVAGWTGCSSVPPPDMTGLAGQAHVLANPELDEASGLAVSLRRADRLWLHNDSGGQPRLFAASTTGDDQGTVTLDGVSNVDWEDIEAFDNAGTPTLLVADVGDNNAVRPAVQLHLLAEPETTGGNHGLTTLTVTYADGPRDCEAVAVDTTERAIYLLTKRDEPPRLYRVALDGALPTRTADFLGTVPTIPEPTEADLAEDPTFGMNRDQPTAMSFSADARTAVVVTYKDAYRYTRADGEAWINVFARAPEIIDIPQMAQTEAGAITADAATLYVASEQLPAPLVRVPLR